MRRVFDQAAALLARLSPREQRLVSVFTALLALTLLWTGLVSPLLAGRGRIAAEIKGLENDLAALGDLGRKIHAAEGNLAGADRSADAEKGFSLLAFVDKAATASLRRESVASMSPGRRPLDGGREESTVELKLSAVTLPEIVALLRDVEGGKSPVYVKHLSIKKRYEDASQFDVTLVTAAVTRG
ncbi:MAG: type II secretion system protein M [Deltaproteobacteria bacterium]|nr:type II secretion system protein M [Deltaproteobacteria bacterium]